MRARRRSLTVLVLLAVAALTVPASAGTKQPEGFLTQVKPYVVGVGDAYQVQPLLSVGDQVPLTGGQGRYQMVGTPDGLGAHTSKGGTVTVYMNHEFEGEERSEPIVGGPLNRGALVSKLELARDGSVLSGDRAYDTVYQENQLVGPAAEEGNATRPFYQFCSGYLAGPHVGFDRYMYFANEEEGIDPEDPQDPGTFDPRGGQAVAIFDNQAHALPRLGFFAHENSVVQPGTGRRTVIMGMEDGPSTPDSQLYLYVGWKDREAKSALGRNGLDNGKLYVFASTDPARNSEATFTKGSIPGRWVHLPNAERLDAVELEEAADRAGAFGFIRIEDGAFSRTHDNDYAFDTTGSDYTAAGEPVNELGRIYRLRLNPRNPLGPARLQVISNNDQVVAAGADTAISPDNVDTSRRYLMVNEDATTEGRAYLAGAGRDASIWRFDLANGYARERVAELDPPGRDGIAVPPGSWETSGIINTSAQFGRDTWLTDVQAHAPTTPPAPNTVEDGQLLLLRPNH